MTLPPFLRDRGVKLLDAIEAAMGKPVQGRDSEEIVHEFNGPLVADSGRDLQS